MDVMEEPYDGMNLSIHLLLAAERKDNEKTRIRLDLTDISISSHLISLSAN